VSRGVSKYPIFAWERELLSRFIDIWERKLPARKGQMYGTRGSVVDVVDHSCVLHEVVTRLK
jgi:hypothetical protein